MSDIFMFNLSINVVFSFKIYGRVTILKCGNNVVFNSIIPKPARSGSQ